MKVDGGFGLGSFDFDAIGRSAKELENVGYDGAWSAETSHDPFFPLLIAAERTESIELGTGKIMWQQPKLTRSSLLMVDGSTLCLGEFAL